MAPTPPPFAQSTYWDERFTKNPAAFDWLLPANCLDRPIIDALRASPNPRPRLLHIGCGTSILSLHLRTHVDDPRQVHNTDFSRVAIDLGARWERDVFESDQALPQDPEESSDGETPPTEQPQPRANSQTARPPRMRWSTLDLLSLPSIRRLAEDEREEDGSAPYDIIVDKSTCDAISCGDDQLIPLPYPLRTTSPTYPSPTPPPTMPLHPLHLLALHLAALVPPAGRWIALSYSAHRFPFFEPFPEKVEEGRLDGEAVEKGWLVHPGRLWRLVGKEMVEVEEESGGEEKGQVVHRPKTAHWVYAMVRTEVEMEW